MSLSIVPTARVFTQGYFTVTLLKELSVALWFLRGKKSQGVESFLDSRLGFIIIYIIQKPAQSWDFS